jgi:hypothetical protein
MHIAVGFVYEPSPTFKSEVEVRANRWTADGSLGSKLRFVFGRPLDECDIRIAEGGSSGVAKVNISLLGRQASQTRLSSRYDSRRQATMIISQLQTTEHEFGHALGLGHEATHKDVIDQIDMDRAVAYYAQEPNRWLPRDTRRNFAETPRCDGDPEFNPASVMLYRLPSEITKFEQTLYDFHNIHRRDRRCVESLYRA